MMKTKLIILWAKEYRVVDDKSGEVNEGVTFNYIMSENLQPFLSDDGKEHGYQPFHDSIKIKLPKTAIFPAVCDAELQMSSYKDERGNSKAKLKLVGLNLTTMTPLLIGESAKKS
jgi:hypothetical protein